jgi:hypothetical protein
MSNELLYTAQQVAAELDCSVSTINRLVKQRQLTKVYLTPGLKRGGCPRITRESIDRYLASLCKQQYSRQCTGASAAKRSSVWQQSTNGKTRRITGAGGNAQTAQELGKKLGVH